MCLYQIQYLEELIGLLVGVDNTLLQIDGAGSTTDYVGANTSSQFVLQNNQTFRSGTNAELDAREVQFTGAGINNLESKKSRYIRWLFSNK